MSAIRISWCTDLHLDTIPDWSRKKFLGQLAALDVSGLVITGDISNGEQLHAHLGQIAEAFTPRPIYFVCGNHDYYGSSFMEVERRLESLAREHDNLKHLGDGEMIPLAPGHVLLGHRGWADGRAGWRNRAGLGRDCREIEDFRWMSKESVREKMMELGRESAVHFRKRLPYALTCYRHVWIATHTPPFRQAVFFDGKPCRPKNLANFTNVCAGGTIGGIARSFPRSRITVLCGHTHSPVSMRIASNVSLHLGRGGGYPEVEGTFLLN